MDVRERIPHLANPRIFVGKAGPQRAILLGAHSPVFVSYILLLIVKLIRVFIFFFLLDFLHAAVEEMLEINQLFFLFLSLLSFGLQPLFLHFHPLN